MTGAGFVSAWEPQHAARKPAAIDKNNICFPCTPEDVCQDVAVREVVKALGEGSFVLVLDDASPDQECYLMMSGESMTPAQMAFMIRQSSGIVNVAATESRLLKLGLSPVVQGNTGRRPVDLYTSTDYLPTTTNGLSAKDRSETVRAFCREECQADEFSKSGHVFPVCCRDEGLTERRGFAEAAHDMCRLAGKPSVVACAALMHSDGELPQKEECVAFSKLHNMLLISISELFAFVQGNGTSPLDSQEPNRESTPNNVPQSLVDACAACTIPVRGNGLKRTITLKIFELADSLPIQVIAAIKGDVDGKEDVAVRIHSECFTGDVLRSAKCDCGLQLEKFFTVMDREPCSVLLYIKGHEGRGIGLAAKMHAYKLQTEHRLDTVDSNIQLGYKPDLRRYDGIVSILHTLGVKSVRMYSNNKEKLDAVRQMLPMRHVPLQTVPLATNRDYLITKEERMQHSVTMLSDEETDADLDDWGA